MLRTMKKGLSPVSFSSHFSPKLPTIINKARELEYNNFVTPSELMHLGNYQQRLLTLQEETNRHNSLMRKT